MMMDPGPTLQTTFSFQLLVDGQWVWYSQAVYSSADDVREVLRQVYGGAFAGGNMHRIVKYTPSILD